MKISFCQTCKNRLYQLDKTIFKNLESIKKDGNSELVLVNYGDTEGLDDFINKYFLFDIRDKALIYLKRDNVDFFEMSKAKNLSHFGATGDYLFNLDADNFINNEINSYRNVWSKYPNSLIHGMTNSKNFNDGSYGRIGIKKEIFNDLGGYDEDFIGIYYEDTDLINRCLLSKMPYAQITSNEKVCIENTRKEAIQFTKFKNYNQDDYYCKNRMISIKKLNNGELKRNLNRKKIKIMKNFIEEIEV